MVTKATDLLKPVSANNKRLQKSNGELQAVRVQLEKDIRELEAAMVREAMAQEAMVRKAEKWKPLYIEAKERLETEKQKVLAELQKQDDLTAQLEQLTVSAQLKQLWLCTPMVD